MSWAELKAGINSTLGTDEFKALNEIIDEQAYKTRYDIAEMRRQWADDLLVVARGTLKIANGAYASNYGITRAVLPWGVEEIGALAFTGCEYLKTLEMPNTVKTIGANAFYQTAITEMVLPRALNLLDEAVFQDCYYLKKVVLQNGVAEIPQLTFERCTALNSVNIPASVTSIGYHAFGECSALREIRIPNSVQDIDPYAFDMCYDLDIYVSFPETDTRAQNAPWGADESTTLVHYNS